MVWTQVRTQPPPHASLADTNARRTDNIAPPVAACLGDLVTLLLLGAVSTVNIVLIDTPLALIILIVVAIAAVGWAIVTRRNAAVSHLLLEGWVPLFAAMIISCGTGIVLDLFVSRYDGFALLAAVIPRLLLTGFTFCQPFLVDATVTWVGNRDAALDSGKGLIAAFAIVYTGMAVSCVPAWVERTCVPA